MPGIHHGRPANFRNAVYGFSSVSLVLLAVAAVILSFAVSPWFLLGALGVGTGLYALSRLFSNRAAVSPPAGARCYGGAPPLYQSMFGGVGVYTTNPVPSLPHPHHRNVYSRQPYQGVAASDRGIHHFRR